MKTIVGRLIGKENINNKNIIYLSGYDFQDYKVQSNNYLDNLKIGDIVVAFFNSKISNCEIKSLNELI